MRKTKIICTIGPASENPEVFREMCLKGLNVARLNFSHGTHEEHQKKIDMIKAVREELKLPVAIMLDTKGPEYRIGTFQNGKITLRDGDVVGKLVQKRQPDTLVKVFTVELKWTLMDILSDVRPLLVVMTMTPFAPREP